MKASCLICSVLMPLFLIGCAQMEKSKMSSVTPGMIPGPKRTITGNFTIGFLSIGKVEREDNS